MARRIQRGVFEFLVLAYRAQHEAPAGHVAQPRECGRKAEHVAEDRPENIDVLASRYTAEENDLGVGFESRSDRSRSIVQGLAIVSLRRIDIDPAHLPDPLLRQPPVG